MKLDDLLGLIPKQWHEAFLRFIDTGDADEGFLAYLDSDTQAQEAVERAIEAQAKAFEGLAKVLASSGSPAGAKTTTEEQAELVSAQMAHALEGALELPQEERHAALQLAASVLRVDLGRPQRRELESLTEDLKNTVAALAVSDY